MAESIVQITAKTPVLSRTSKSSSVHFASSIQESIYRNRPYLLVEKSRYLKNMSKDKKSSTSPRAFMTAYRFPEADKKWNYRIKFDVSL